LRQKRATAPDGGVGPPRPFPGGSALLSGVKRYVNIRPPTLFIVSSQSPGRWAQTSTDPAISAQIAGLNALQERQAKAIDDGLPRARVVKLPRANHYVFLSNEADVLREMRAFLARLR
jgi:pimeloyl-ACP methyl ester carboxylesterase